MSRSDNRGMGVRSFKSFKITIPLSEEELKRTRAAACLREMEIKTYMRAAVQHQADMDLGRRHFEIDPHERRPAETHGVALRRRGRP